MAHLHMEDIDNVSGTHWLPTAQSRLRSLDFDAVALYGSIHERTELAHQIKRDADALATLQAELRRSANSLSSVMRLPAEILLVIFTLLSAEEPPNPPLHRRNVRLHGWGSIDNGPYGSLGWVRLLHVCHDWRSLIESAPTLWARHVYCLPAAEDTFLERSCDTPLHITIASPEISCSLCDCCKSTEPHTLASRTRSLSWKVNHASDLPSLMTFLRQRAMPLLQKADIQYEYAEELVDCRSLDVIDTPQLKDLTLHKMAVPFMAPSLTSFKLENIQVSEDELLDVLRRYPNLEDLVLEECFVIAPASSGGRIVELNRLRSITMKAGRQLIYDPLLIVTTSNYIAFLQRLRLPRATVYSIGIYPRRPTGTDIITQDLSLLSTISQAIQTNDRIIGMRFFRSTIDLFTSVGEIHPESLPKLDHRFTFEDDSRCSYGYYNPLSHFIRFLSTPGTRNQFQSLTVLTILYNNVVVDWEDLSLALPSLRVLQIASAYPECTPSAVASSSTGEGVLLPLLRHFGVWGVQGLPIYGGTLSALVGSLADRCSVDSDGKLASLCVGKLADRNIKKAYTPLLAMYADYVVWPDDPDDVSP